MSASEPSDWRAEAAALIAQAEECRRQAARTCGQEAVAMLEQLAAEYEAKARLITARAEHGGGRG